MTDDLRRTIDATWRAEAARVIAAVARVVRDVGLAEELAQDALVAALETWPKTGIPDKPAAWLTTTARNLALDRHRRDRVVARKHEALGQAAAIEQDLAMPDAEDRLDDHVGDDLLRLVFIACHPVLPPEGRVALTLRLLGGLTTDEIARAFLVPEATVAQRIVRAKRTLAEAGIEFGSPTRQDLHERLGTVLGVVYLVFNEGYSATAGDDWMRPALCRDALRLGNLVARVAPDVAEVHGLVALMELQHSRTAARTAPDGTPILLGDQDRAKWDHDAIVRGLAALERALRLGDGLGPYTLQASIAACHARAPTAEFTDWHRIAATYDTLAVISPSPVVELNRAVAHGLAHGPAAGLAIADALVKQGALANYHLLPGVRADLLEKLGKKREARSEYLRAASLTRNQREKALLGARAAACDEAKPE